MTPIPYLGGYPPDLQARAEDLLASGELKRILEARYPDRHDIHSSKALSVYVQELKARYMRTAAPLAKVQYDNSLHHAHNALGIQTTATRVQGSKLRRRRELRVASFFKSAPPEFLRMIVVHELAHLKHTDHDKDFYKLCTYMDSDYHQLELDLRLYLTVRDAEAG